MTYQTQICGIPVTSKKWPALSQMVMVAFVGHVGASAFY